MINDKPVIITLIPIPPDIPSYQYLQNSYNLVSLPLTNEEDVLSKLSIYPYSEAVAIYGSYPGFVPIGGLMSLERINKLPPNLKVIGLCSAGYGGNDLNGLRSRNINLCHVPTGLAQSDVADCAIWHVLSGVRKFQSWNDHIRRSVQETGKASTLKIRADVDPTHAQNNNFSFGHVYKNKYTRRSRGLKAVIIGYGGIGKEIAKRLDVLGMEIVGLVRNVDKYTQGMNNKGQPIDNLNVVIDSINNLVEACSGRDIVILCLPGNPHTEGILNKRIFDVLNDSSIIVNVGRGSLINSDDLKEACHQGKVDHVGLDVFTEEPEIDPFWVADNDFSASLTPHVGVSTNEAYQQACETCVQNILNGLELNIWNNVVN